MNKQGSAEYSKCSSEYGIPKTIIGRLYEALGNIFFLKDINILEKM